MKNKLNWLLIFGLFMSGCALKEAPSGYAGTGPVRPRVDLSDYGRIGVADFVSYGSYLESGAQVTEEFIEQLSEEEKEVLSLGKLYGQTANSLVMVGSGYEVEAVLTGSITGYEPVTENETAMAKVRITAELMDVKKGEVLWTASQSAAQDSMEKAVREAVYMLITDLKER
jgi:TolB-like protein